MAAVGQPAPRMPGTVHASSVILTRGLREASCSGSHSKLVAVVEAWSSWAGGASSLLLQPPFPHQ